MKTFLPTLCMALLTTVSVQASPALRHLDSHATQAEGQALQIQRDIYRDFRTSRDFRELTRDADELAAAVHAIHDAVHFGRGRAGLDGLVRNAQKKLDNLRECLSHSDFMAFRPAYRHVTPTRSVSFPATMHPGHIHVRSVERSLDRLARHLDEMRSDLAPVHHHHRGPVWGR